MELADDGDLYQRILKLQNVQDGHFQENDIWKILIQVSSDTFCLHCIDNLCFESHSWS